MRALIPENEFIELYRKYGPKHLVRLLKSDDGTIGQRRRAIERRLGVEIRGPREKNSGGMERIPVPQGEPTVELNIKDGHIVVASDCHYWPGRTPLMHKAVVAICKEYKPKAVILNGDVMDLPSVSRHDPIGWENWPKVYEEIEWAQDKTHEIAVAAGRCEKIWTFGNHDERFESRLARNDPEYAKIHGVHLKDHFPLWRPCRDVIVNPHSPDETQIKHNFKGGEHKVYRNILHTGAHSVTSHLHAAEVRAVTFLHDKTLWGVDTGCVADTNDPAFKYTRNNPLNWRSAFCLLTYREGRLMMPELILKFDDKRVQFRGEVFTP